MFVEYESHRAAALARRKLLPGKVYLFGVELGQVEKLRKIFSERTSDNCLTFPA